MIAILAWLRRRKPDTGPRCNHTDAVEVHSHDALVAGLCPGCSLQLTPEWFTCDHSSAEMVTVDKAVIRWIDIGHSLRMTHHRCPTCRSDWWAPTTIADWHAWI